MYHIDAHRAEFTPAQLIALRYTELVTTDAANIESAVYSALQDHFDDDAIVEMTALIGFINYLNRFADALKL